MYKVTTEDRSQEHFSVSFSSFDSVEWRRMFSTRERGETVWREEWTQQWSAYKRHSADLQWKIRHKCQDREEERHSTEETIESHFQRRRWSNHYSVNKEELTPIVVAVNIHRIRVWHVADCLKCERSVEHWFGGSRNNIVDKRDHWDCIAFSNRLIVVRILSSDVECSLVQLAVLDENIRLSNKCQWSADKREKSISSTQSTRSNNRRRLFFHFDRYRNRVVWDSKIDKIKNGLSLSSNLPIDRNRSSSIDVLEDCKQTNFFSSNRSLLNLTNEVRRRRRRPISQSMGISIRVGIGWH